MAFIAAVTKTIRLCSGVLILPQRQTGLVAKQAAQVDVLSGGRVRLGVGVGWNHVEYEALGTEWKTRGARQAEQIEVMRKLWTEDLVTFRGRFHSLIDVTMLPVPVQRPIPIWFGGSSDAVVKRAARLGDGWMPIMSPEVAEPKLAMLREHLKSFGRDPAKFGLEGWLRFDDADPQPARGMRLAVGEEHGAPLGFVGGGRLPRGQGDGLETKLRAERPREPCLSRARQRNRPVCDEVRSRKS